MSPGGWVHPLREGELLQYEEVKQTFGDTAKVYLCEKFEVITRFELQD